MGIWTVMNGEQYNFGKQMCLF